MISKFLSSMTLYNYPLYFKSGEINSCELSTLPTNIYMPQSVKELKYSRCAQSQPFKFQPFYVLF